MTHFRLPASETRWTNECPPVDLSAIERIKSKKSFMIMSGTIIVTMMEHDGLEALGAPAERI